MLLIHRCINYKSIFDVTINVEEATDYKFASFHPVSQLSTVLQGKISLKTIA